MKDKAWIDRITYFSIVWTCVFLPLKTTISNAGLMLLLLSTLASFLLKGIRKEEFRKPVFYFSTTLALFIPIIIGTLYAPEADKAFAQLGKCVFYALVPLIFLRKDMNRTKAILWASRGLLIGVLGGVIYLLVRNMMAFAASDLPLEKLLSYNYTGKLFLAPIREMHPVYFGSYVLFSLVLLWRESFIGNHYAKILVSVVLIIGLIFLNSRIVFLIGLLFLGLAIFRGISLKRLLIVLGVVVLFIFLVLPTLRGTYVYNKLIEGSKWEMKENIASKNLDRDQTADSRMSRWLVSRDLFLKKPIFGHGTGSARDLLVEVYTEKNMKASLAQGYDSHNQYLGYAIEYGILGTVFLLLFFGTNIYKAIRSRFSLLLTFTLMIGLLCLTENYLIRNMGINFVALFGNLLILRQHD